MLEESAGEHKGPSSDDAGLVGNFCDLLANELDQGLGGNPLSHEPGKLLAVDGKCAAGGNGSRARA